jgi:O-antigen ligase
MTFAGILYQLILLDFSVLLSRGMRLRSRLVLVGALAFQFVAIVFTMTRGAWLALAAGLFAACVMVRGRVAAVAAVVLVLALVAFSFGNFHVQEGRSIPELVHSGLDKDASTRVVLWDIAWSLFNEHPVLGVGMGDYSTEADKLLSGRQVTTTVDTHNVFLHVLATRGLVGFLPFVYFWVALFGALLGLKRRLPKGSFDHQCVVGAIAATVAVLVGALTELNIDDGEVWMAFMFVLGLALAPLYRTSPKAAEIRSGTAVAP